jgi:hypothetical protein
MLNQMQNQINVLNAKMNDSSKVAGKSAVDTIAWPLVCPYCHVKIKKSELENLKINKDPGAITLPLMWEHFLDGSSATQPIISEKKLYAVIFQIYEQVVDNYNKNGAFVV